MNKNNKNNNKKQTRNQSRRQGRPQPNRSTRNGGRGRIKGTGGGNQLSRGLDTSAFTRMILDPCNATLVPGLYGSSEGMLARVKHSFTLAPSPNGVVNDCGYMLWCPDFHNVALANNQPGNIFCFLANGSLAQPRNDNATQFGKFNAQSSILSNDTAFTISDPAGPLVQSNIVQDARVLSACMTTTFLGKMVDSSGEICFLQNVPISELIGSGTNTCTSVNALFNYSANKQRLGVETIESIYRPNLNSSQLFRDSTVRPLDIPAATNVTAQNLESEPFGPRVFGVAWRGVQSDAQISFDFIKNIEWRPEAVSGFSQVPIVGASPGILERTLKYADNLARSNPAVWVHIKGLVGQGAAYIARTAFTGPRNHQIL